MQAFADVEFSRAGSELVGGDVNNENRQSCLVVVISVCVSRTQPTVWYEHKVRPPSGRRLQSTVNLCRKRRGDDHEDVGDVVSSSREPWMTWRTGAPAVTCPHAVRQTTTSHLDRPPVVPPLPPEVQGTRGDERARGLPSSVCQAAISRVAEATVWRGPRRWLKAPGC